MHPKSHSASCHGDRYYCCSDVVICATVFPSEMYKFTKQSHHNFAKIRDNWIKFSNLTYAIDMN